MVNNSDFCRRFIVFFRKNYYYCGRNLNFIDMKRIHNYLPLLLIFSLHLRAASAENSDQTEKISIPNQKIEPIEEPAGRSSGFISKNKFIVPATLAVGYLVIKSIWDYCDSPMQNRPIKCRRHKRLPHYS